MLKPALIFVAGALLMLLFLGAMERPINNYLDNVKNKERSSDHEITVRSTQELGDENQTSAIVEQQTEYASSQHSDETAQIENEHATQQAAEQRVAEQIAVLLAEEPSLHRIIETNIELLGEVSGSAAFLHHRALLSLINQTENIQPMSIVCSNQLCNIVVYGSTAAIAEQFSEQLISDGAATVKVINGEYRLFQEDEHNFSHIVLETAVQH